MKTEVHFTKDEVLTALSRYMKEFQGIEVSRFSLSDIRIGDERWLGIGSDLVVEVPDAKE